MESTVTIELARQLYIIQSRLDSSAEAEAEAETSMRIRRQHPIELMVCLFSHSDLFTMLSTLFPAFSYLERDNLEPELDFTAVTDSFPCAASSTVCCIHLQLYRAAAATVTKSDSNHVLCTRICLTEA